MGRLLAVDDNVESAELVARVAMRCGHDARWLSNPNALKKALREWAPDVLTLDLCMPDADGIGLLSMLQEIGYDGQIVIISGQDAWTRQTAARIAEGRGLMVADDVEKPVDLGALQRLLSRLMPNPPCVAAPLDASTEPAIPERHGMSASRDPHFW
jgi:DNA-binding NtrC family response regulator